MFDAAARELDEELDVKVKSIGVKYLEVHDPGSSFIINFYHIDIVGDPKPIEHSNLAWVEKDNLLNFDLAINDQKFVEYYLTIEENI